MLLPVVKSYEDRQTQLRMHAFVTMTHRFSKIRSKRLQAAVSAVAGGPLSEDLTLAAGTDTDEAEPRKASAKPRKRKNAAGGTASAELAADVELGSHADVRRSKRAKKGNTNAGGGFHGNDPAAGGGQDDDDGGANTVADAIDGGDCDDDEDDDEDDLGLGVPVDASIANFFY